MSLQYVYKTSKVHSVSVTRLFGLFLFHESNPPGPLINRPKWFRWKIHFRGDIREISMTPHWLTLRGIIKLNLRNPKVTNTARSQAPRPSWLTLRGALSTHILSLRASPCLERENSIYLKYVLPMATFFICFLMASLSNKSSRKLIFQQNHFSLFIRDPGGLDS